MWKHAIVIRTEITGCLEIQFWHFKNWTTKAAYSEKWMVFQAVNLRIYSVYV